jgi:hypothetical protein
MPAKFWAGFFARRCLWTNPRAARTHPHNFPEKERSEGQENTAAAVEVRLPSPEDDYAEPDFESVFSISHQLAP